MFKTLHGRRRMLGFLLLACTTGCAVTFDEMTSKEFKFSQFWSAPPSPMQILETSTDGYARAKAFTRLDEARNDPTLETKQINMLQQAALSDRDVLVRMAAIRTLGRYTDPRDQGRRLLTAIRRRSPPNTKTSSVSRLSSRLETTSPAEARQMFLTAAKQPAGELTATSQRDRLEILDERLAAIRALGKYNAPDSIETLVVLVEKEKDVAIKQCAAESLKKHHEEGHLCADGKLWHDYFATGKVPPPSDNSMFAVFSRSDANPVQVIGNWTKPAPAPAVTTSTPQLPPTGAAFRPADDVAELRSAAAAGSADVEHQPGAIPDGGPDEFADDADLDPGHLRQPAAAELRSRATAATPTGTYRNSAGEIVCLQRAPIDRERERRQAQ